MKYYSLENLILLILLMLVPFTHPILTYPYDIYAHLIAIDEIYHKLPSSTSIPESRLLWHSIWSKIFWLFNIDNAPFLRAKIIHIIQSYLAFFALYYFSNVIIRNLFKHISNPSVHLLSVWSVIVWYTLYATGVGYDHQIWNQFYSVNYQITLPLFWYITALTFVIFLENISLKKKIFFIVQIVLISKFILQVHSMEFMYYLMYISAFILINIDKAYTVAKKYIYLIIPLFIAIIYFIKNFQSDSSKIFTYMHFDKMHLLHQTIADNGRFIVKYLNRAEHSINELMYIIAILSLFVIIHLVWRDKNKIQTVNIRVFFLVVITSLFVLIPLFEFSSGLFGVITRKDVIHRIYYSSSMFILLPVSIYYISQLFHFKFKYIHIILFTIVLGTAIFSKHYTLLQHNYYRNIQSIKHSFSKEYSGFNLSKNQINLIGNLLHSYELKNHSGGKEYYYARADISFVIKYIYRKKVYWKGRRANPNYKKLYREDTHNQQYHKVLFETPKGFPRYIPYW